MFEKIYVVTRGDYSDYHIITATTDEKRAKKIAKKFNAEVETYDDSEVYLKQIFSINFDKNGNVTECEENNNDYDYPVTDRCFEHKNKTFYVEVEADDKESAIKIAAEKRAKFLAEKEGIV